MFKEPSGETVQLDFYFSTRSAADGLRDVVRFCLGEGSTFSGQALIAGGYEVRSRGLKSIYSLPSDIIHVLDEELTVALDGPNTRFLKVGIWSAIGITKEVPEVVTYSGISEDALERDNNPISIVSEGWVFSTPGYEEEADRAGELCFRRFHAICRALSPDYAAILNEESLPCLYDLRRGGGKRCFRDFFVSELSVGADVIDELESLFRNAYRDRSAKGLYVSTSPFYNPGGTSLPDEVAANLSARAAAMIGGAIPYVSGASVPGVTT